MSMSITDCISLFTLGFGALFPLVNPIGTALIVNPFFEGTSPSDRRQFAFKVVFYSFVLSVATLCLGSVVLRFMGIAITTTEMAGGVVIAQIGMKLLNSGANGDQQQDDARKCEIPNVAKSLFYPIAFPLTVGPGCISVLIALSAHTHSGGVGTSLERKVVLAVSALATLVITYFCFIYSSVIIRRIGSSGSIVLNRLMAFIVFCVGIQMSVNGLMRAFPKIF